MRAYKVGPVLAVAVALACGGSDEGELTASDGGGGRGGEGGGAAASGGSGGEAGSSPEAPCENSLDCVDQPGGRSVCDVGVGACVECVQSADCDTAADCISNRCVAFTPCDNSLDCPTGQVCDATRMRCAECARDTDCGSGTRCYGSHCRTPCTSDNQCTPQGLLCDFGVGLCVTCVRDTDCSAAEYCEAGVCEPDRCVAGQTRCESGALSTCDESGRAYGVPTACPVGTECVATGGTARCAGGNPDAGTGGVAGSGGGAGTGGLGGSAGDGGTAGAGGVAGSGGGGPVGCAGGLDGWILLDHSGSTAGTLDTGTILEAMSTGVNQWVTSASGARFGLVSFPRTAAGVPTSCCTDQECGAYGPCMGALIVTICALPGTCSAGGGCSLAAYDPPDLGLTALPDTGNLFSGVLSSLVGSGQTPTHPALEQTLIHAAQSSSASGRKTIVVLLTDGAPNFCTVATIDGLAQLAGTAAAASPSIVTYVMNLDTAGAFDPVTAASGGVTVDIAVTTAASTATAIRGGFDTIAQHACAP